MDGFDPGVDGFYDLTNQLTAALHQRAKPLYEREQTEKAPLDTVEAFEDPERRSYGAVERGINYDDFVTAIAPDQVCIGATTSDFFPIEGVEETVERAQRVYERYDAERSSIERTEVWAGPDAE